MQIERRYFTVPNLEIRAKAGEPFVAIGHAATYNEPYGVGDFREQIAPGAFDGVLNDPDTLTLWNHNADNVLGSVGSKTLALASDERGLLSTMTFPSSALREREALERGDVRKMSFGFTTGEDKWELLADGSELRTIITVAKLWDVSPVAYPANPATDLGLAQRSRESWRTAHPPSREWQRIHANRARRLDLAESDVG